MFNSTCLKAKIIDVNPGLDPGTSVGFNVMKPGLRRKTFFTSHALLLCAANLCLATQECNIKKM